MNKNSLNRKTISNLQFRNIMMLLLFFLSILVIYILYETLQFKNEQLEMQKEGRSEYNVQIPISKHEMILATKMGFPLVVEKRDKIVANELFLTRLWEKHLSIVLEKLINPGDTIIEIGANYGYHSVFMSQRIGTNGKLVSYEANPSVCHLLHKNIVLNNLSHNTVMKCIAVSDSSGLVKFLRGFSNLGGSFVLPQSNAAKDLKEQSEFKNWQEIEVKTTTLTEDLNDIQTIDVLRMDAEGSELPILRGAWKFIQNSKNIKIITEWDTDMLSRFGSVALLLEDLEKEGFHFYLVNEQGSLLKKTKEEMLALPHSDVVMMRD